MWVLLSRRIRAWLILAVAVPVARATVHRVAVAVQQRNPSGRPARVLRRTDAAVATAARHARRRRR